MPVTSRPRTVVLVPVAGRIEPECERALAALAKNGCEIRRMSGHSAIDVARSLMANQALADGFDELMWIDADVAFPPDAIDRLRRHDLPIVCGIYPKKLQRELACHLLPETKELVFGERGGLVEIRYAATGFLYTRREVFSAIREKLSLPLCNERFGQGFHPYFLPMLLAEPDGAGGTHHWYLGEDYAFCERAREAGFRVYADTTIRLTHIGRYGFEWEDAGGDRQRYATFRIVLTEEVAKPK
jgi:hypothetical protein